MTNKTSPIAYINSEDLQTLQNCNGQSIWAESPNIHQDNPAVTAVGLVPVYLESQSNSLVNIAHTYIREALKLPKDAPMRFDYYAQKIEALSKSNENSNLVWHEKADRLKKCVEYAITYNEKMEFQALLSQHLHQNEIKPAFNNPVKLEETANLKEALSQVFEWESEANSDWRRLSLQFDEHRMIALCHLKAMVKDSSAHVEYAKKFLAESPISGEEVLAKRIVELALKSKGE